jgi:hypothetical protein
MKLSIRIQISTVVVVGIVIVVINAAVIVVVVVRGPAVCRNTGIVCSVAIFVQSSADVLLRACFLHFTLLLDLVDKIWKVLASSESTAFSAEKEIHLIAAIVLRASDEIDADRDADDDQHREQRCHRDADNGANVVGRRLSRRRRRHRGLFHCRRWCFGRRHGRHRGARRERCLWTRRKRRQRQRLVETL